ELVSKPNYHEFRYIGADDGGRELVRVDRSDAGVPPRIVPDNELQRKGDREAFRQTIRLPAGEVYVSQIDLSVESPRIPVLRVATPVYAPDGRPFGIVIINVDIRPASVRLADGPRVILVQALAYQDLTVATSAVRDSSLMAGFAAAFCAFVLAVIVARSLTRPLVQMTRVVQGFSRDEAVALPTGGGYEIGVLAREFADMAAESHAKTAALNREIEAQKKAQQALLESEQMARDVIENALDAFIQSDEAGNILEWNPR